MHRVILIFTSSYNKVCRDIAYFNTKMSYLSDFKRTKSKTLRTASSLRMTNWTKPPCHPVQIIRTKRLIFLKFDYRKYNNILLLNNLHVIYFWNRHKERRSSHWHLQLHTRLAERYRWRYANLRSVAIISHWFTRTSNTFNRENTG